MKPFDQWSPLMQTTFRELVKLHDKCNRAVIEQQEQEALMPSKSKAQARTMQTAGAQEVSHKETTI